MRYMFILLANISLFRIDRRQSPAHFAFTIFIALLYKSSWNWERLTVLVC